MLYKQYEPNTLEKLKRYELEILKDFTDFCEANNVDYFAVGGTTIGIARHGGFIPWDDDIDIGLTRANYDKFLKIASDKLSDKYKIINAENYDNFPLMTTRLALKGTKFKEDCFKNLDIENGIFLDLYCFDNIPDDEKKMKRQGFGAWFWGKILVLIYIGEPVLYNTGIKARLTTITCKLMHSFFRLIKLSPKKAYNRAKKFSCMYKNRKTRRIAYMFDPSPYTSIMDIQDVEPTVFRQFEDLQIRCPKNMEKYIEYRYGADYMTLPPEDKRHNHPPYELEFREGDN